MQKMVDFGGQFVIENQGVPWLIWIQIVVLFLLFFVIYFAALSTCSDQPETSAAGRASSSEFRVSGESKSAINGNSSRAVINCLQVGENQNIEREMVTNTRRRIVQGEDALERENLSAKETTSNCLHPCQYFSWARHAFLKCLGLDSDRTASSSTEQRRES